MASNAATGTAKSAQKSGDKDNLGFFGRIFQFIREVIAELKKVTTPTRRELLSYVVIVLLFVAFMMLLIFGLDYLLGQGAFWVFGNGSVQTS